MNSKYIYLYKKGKKKCEKKKNENLKVLMGYHISVCQCKLEICWDFQMKWNQIKGKLREERSFSYIVVAPGNRPC